MEIINLKDLLRWAEMKPGEVIKFNAGNPRKVRLQVNCRFQTAFYIVHVDDLTGELAERFLATAPAGLAVIEFMTGGQPFRIGADASDAVLYYTAEMEATGIEVPDAESFTKIAHRRARNPELEQMMFLMNQNMERRLAQMDRDHARQIAELAARGVEDAETLVGRTGGDLHIGAPSQREELAQADGALAGTAKAGGNGRKKSPVLPVGSDGAASASDSDDGEAGSGAA
ncbi:hypothetical protein [Mesorhizobium sp.]|uniref:hypothetical protein n=1 Tax=Mesorhizobium sp. TaxID=1871066 RepID=UPI00120893ED|nr:hypothetical protein [Mesorhizobium sp.]TIS45688.1 MAG: hypothetical protein E5W96_30215 [Mesorhizobium sp.]